MSARDRDFIDRVDRNGRRINAIETGAHPVGLGLSFGASLALTDLPKDSAAWTTQTFLGVTAYFARIKKRLSIVQFHGILSGALHTVGPGGLKVSHVPAGCAPASDATFFVAIDRAPYFTRLVVKENRDVILYNTPAFTTPDSGGTDLVHLDNVNYVAEV